MSWWTYVKGVFEVSVPGRTQAEIRYILESVLDHLPRVTGSEGDMNVHIVQEAGYRCSSSHDEFGMKTDNLIDFYGCKSRRGMLHTQDRYMLAVEGDLRDTEFEETKRSFLKWLCRLAKRINVCSVVVMISEYGHSMIISDAAPFDSMYEWGDNEKLWTNYLRWERDPGSDMPLMLADKYLSDNEVSEELKRRFYWHESMN